MVNDAIICDVVTLHDPGSVVDPDRTLEGDGCTVTAELGKPGASGTDEDLASHTHLGF